MGPRGGTPSHPYADNRHRTSAVLWLQSSAEARSLYRQIFKSAKQSLDECLAQRKSRRPPAVVSDIDETILSTMSYHARSIRDDVPYPHGWEEWLDKEGGRPLPGAAEFLRYAKSKGCDIFYVTERPVSSRGSTLATLRKAGFPDASASRLLAVGSGERKGGARRKIMETHEIVLLLGDQLHDFSSKLASGSNLQRERQAQWMKSHFGRRFILLPNPVYGDWERALYDYDAELSPELQNQVRTGALQFD